MSVQHIDPTSTIRLATERLDRAQTELSAAIADLPTVDRADKQIITQRLKLAFEEIVAAKDALAELLPDTEAPSDSSQPD